MSTSLQNQSSQTASSGQPSLLIKRLSENAVIPTRGSDLSAGYDLSASQPATIPPGGRAIVRTDLSIACPPGTYGRVAPRSGLTVKKGIHVGAGVIDADYRGAVGVVLFNLGQEDFEIKQGDRIAQLILEEIMMVPVLEVDDLDETVRGSGGFGSTGVETAAKKQRTVSPTIEGEGSTPDATGSK